MSKHKKIVLISFIVLLLIIIFSNTNVVKAENNTQEKVIQYNEEINTQILDDIHSTKFKVLSTPKIKVEANPEIEDIDNYYYTQLKTDFSRNTYNALTNQISNKVIIDLKNAEFNIEQVNDENIAECFKTNILPYILDGYEAYIMDGAENYWWTPEGIQIGELATEYVGNKVIFNTVEVISTAEEWANHDNFNTKFKEVCNSITGKSTYEIARSINYYIYNNVEYKILDDTTMEQSAYGALILKQAVCEGQAQLFKLMCKEKGIKCLNIYGFVGDGSQTTAHAWNYVYEPTKKQWYAVDVTWNTSYKDSLYFMVGSDTEINGVKFGRNHIAGFKQFTMQTYTPSTPTYSNEKYIDGITISSDMKYITNIQPDTEYNEFLKEFSSNDLGTFTVTDGNNTLRETDLLKTGQSFNIGNLSITTVVLGDVNGDGQADIKDILRINKHRLNKDQLTDCYLKAGDANKDGTVDIKDILRINKFRLGKINEI